MQTNDDSPQRKLASDSKAKSFKIPVPSIRRLVSLDTSFWDASVEVSKLMAKLQASGIGGNSTSQLLEIMLKYGIPVYRQRILASLFLVECFQALSARWRSQIKYSDLVLHLSPIYRSLRSVWRTHGGTGTFQGVIDGGLRAAESKGGPYTPQALVAAMRAAVVQDLGLTSDAVIRTVRLPKVKPVASPKIYKKAKIFCTYARIDHLLRRTTKPFKLSMVLPSDALERAGFSRGQAQAWLIAAQLFGQMVPISVAYMILNKAGFEDPRKIHSEVKLNVEHPLHFLMKDLESSIEGMGEKS